MNRIYLLPCLLALPLFAACGDGGFELPPEGPVEAAVGPPLAITSAQACAVESDCRADAVCFQGQCAVADEDTLAALNAMTASGGNPGSIPGLAIEGLPDRVQSVAEGQTNVQVSFTLSAEPADGRLAYRLERDDQPDAPAQVERASVSGRTVTLTLAAGDADPARGDESSSVYVNVISAAGTVSLILVPAFPEAGGYAGQAVLNTFGQLGLPISLSVVTDPPGATLEAATAAYLVLPVRPGSLFNPEPFATDGATFVTSALEYDDFARAWVAQFRRPYSLAETSAFGWVESPSNAVTRRMRFELSPNGNGKLVGQISDRWSGLFEQRSSAGVLVPTDIAFEGTVDLQRVAAPPTLADVTPPIDITPQPAGLLPVPVLDQCAGVAFTATATVAGQARTCAGITDAAGFAMAAAQAQADCALAMAESSLGAGTTAQQIVDFLDEGTPNPGGQSFAEFMQDCVAQTNGTCVPPAAVLCSRQLAAHAIKSSSESSPDLIELVLHYQSTTREAFLGRQFGAFYADAQTRLDWLQAQDFPAIVTAAVQSFVAGLLDDWQANVLDAHVGVLRGQFDSAGGAVLGQDLSAAPEANTAQRQLLLETSQSWRSAAEAFALAADRWGTLLTEARARSEKADYVYDRALDLYVIAGLLAEQNRAAGAGANNAVFAGGFRPLVDATRQLALPFDKLIFERQGEVVISTSLDPMRGNEAILDDLRMQAMMQVSGADEAVTEVLSQAQAELLQQAELTARFVNEADALQSEIANLCGLPMGCTEPDADACAPRVTVGTCGFIVSSAGDVVTAFPDEANPSEAGAAILEVRARSLAWQRARAAYRAHTTKLSIDYANTAAFAERTEQWNVQRLAVVAEAQTGVEQLRMSADAAVQALGESLAEQYDTRVTSIEGTQAAIKDWEKTRLNGITSDFNRLVGAAVNRGIASSLEREAAIERDLADAAVEGLPKATGTANDTTFAARMAIKMTGVVVTRGLDIVSLIAEQAAEQTEVAAARAEAIREAQLTRLEQESDVGSDQVEADVERSRNTAAMIVTASQFEQGIIRETIINLERELEATLAYERDVQALEDRRADVSRQLAETEELLIQITQAELGVTQAIMQYARAVQRAQLLSGRLATVRNQLDNVNQLLGSPAAVFAWANRLSRAENRLERAKDAVMEWVVALEYFAVRPFFDARIQILLARNTTQLEAIAQELLRLQNACGGAVNTEQVEVSVRKDLLGISDAVEDLRTGAAPAPTERFRTLLREARVPIDKRVRYRSDATVGDLLNRGGILAATFPIDIDEFANLGVSCNAKIQGVAVKLVGEGLGEARPVVSVLYDGTSRLRSCQPNIRSLVDLVGRDLTPFGEVTELEVVGRGVAPVAGVNAFPENKNISLGGLPLVSQYTVLIDPEAGENAQIDWSKLDDIELRIEYGYQDLFPEGQCQ